jgi:hypothetical protein
VLSLLATTADNFFIPQLETLSKYLKLSPDVAGITLLALGNGAPDVFAAKAALSGGDESDFPLMLSDLLGASVFISTVVLGSVCLVANATFSQWTIDRRAFLRDVVVYMVAVSVILIVASDGKITTGEASMFLGIYAVYIAIVVAQSRMKLRGGGGRDDPDVRRPAGADTGERSEPSMGDMADPMLGEFKGDYAADDSGSDGEGSQSCSDASSQPDGTMAGLDWDSGFSRFEKVGARGEEGEE